MFTSNVNSAYLRLPNNFDSHFPFTLASLITYKQKGEQGLQNCRKLTLFHEL